MFENCAKARLSQILSTTPVFVELRPFPPAHLRTLLLNFVATGVYALSLKSLPAVFFPCQQSFFLSLFELFPYLV